MAIYKKKDANAVIFRLEENYTKPDPAATDFDVSEPIDENKVIRFAMHWTEHSTKGDKNLFDFLWQENSTKIEKNCFDFKWIEALSTRETTVFDFRWVEKERFKSPYFRQNVGAKKSLTFPQYAGAKKELKFIQPITFQTKHSFLAVQQAGARAQYTLHFKQHCQLSKLHKYTFLTAQKIGIQGQFLAVQQVGAWSQHTLHFKQYCELSQMHKHSFLSAQKVGIQGQFLAGQQVGAWSRYTLHFKQYCGLYKRQKREFYALQYCELSKRHKLHFKQYCGLSKRNNYTFLAVQNVKAERIKTVSHAYSFMLKDHKISVLDYSVSIGINDKNAALTIERECYFKIKLEDIIDININGISFSLQVKSKDKSLSNSSVKYNVNLGKIEDKEIIIYSLEVNKKLSEIVQELYTDKEIIINCNDILINKNSFMATGTRGECLKSLLDPLLMFADLQQNKIIIYSQYPVTSGVAVRYGFDEFKSYAKTIHSTKNYSEIDVYSAEERISPYTLIQEKQDDGSVLIKTPVVSEKEADTLTLVHTGTAATTIKRIGFRVENKTETLEFIRGKAQTQHKIKSISSYAWQHNDLGTLTYKDKELTAEKDDIFGASILNVTYEAAFLVFRVFNTNYTTTQFLLIDKEE